jgi:hypothetical protein
MSTKPREKPGKRSDIQGARQEFLSDFYPTYAKASERGTTREIWDDLFKRYWKAFLWRLPLTQEPDPEDSTDYGRAPQTPEEVKEREQLMPMIEAVGGVRF